MATKQDSGGRKATPRVFSVAFDGKPEKAPDMQVVAIDRAGRMLAAATVRGGKAELPLADEELRTARVFVTPMPRGGDKDPFTIAKLERLRAYEALTKPVPGEREIALAPIPEFHWQWWLLCACRVRGRVVKRVNVGGVLQDRPVPAARVHVCEVDRLPWIIWKLPDPDLFRLRDDLLDALARPKFPRPPFPEPEPWPIIPEFTDPLPPPFQRLAQAALNPQPLPPRERAFYSGSLPTARDLAAEPAHRLAARQLIAAGAEVGFDPQPEPPAFAVEALARLDAPVPSALASHSPALLRQALIERIDLVRAYLCDWPWFWPWLTCDEVAVVETDAQGRFDTTILYPCAGDHPDLYFWVEYLIGGVWTTVHRPPMRCHTHWDYPCGSEVTVRIHDCRVPTAEGDPTPLVGTKVHVIRLGGVYVSQIGAGGLTAGGAPFAEQLRPYVEFAATELAAAGVTHYRWSYRRLTLADGVTAAADTWHELDTPVTHHYTEIEAGGTWRIKPFFLGPDAAVSGANVFRIRPQEPPIAPSSLNGWWTTYGVDEGVSGVFKSNEADVPAAETTLDAGGAKRAAGLFLLKLEMFRVVGGTAVQVNLPRDGFVIPPDPPVSGGVITPVVAPDSMVERVNPLDPASPVSAFYLRLRVDNYPCEAAISNTMIGATAANACGMLSYAPGATATLAFKAKHPHQFATFSFTLVRGSPGVNVNPAGASGGVGDANADGYTRDATSTFTKSVPVASLLGACPAAAFAENLYVAAMATNGYRRIHELDRSATSAFALIPA